MKNLKIAVLLAACNGAKYISQQMDSLLSQTIPVDIYISVDPSLDNTLSLAKSYAERHINIICFHDNVSSGSSCANFIKLLNLINLENYDFIAFSDQDDIWLPDKIEKSISELSDHHCEIISTSMLPFSDDLRTHYDAINTPSPIFSKYSFLLKSYGSACTSVVTTKAALIIKSKAAALNNNNQSCLEFFDWLISAIASFEGLDWYQSTYVSMFYRQHQDNVLGASLSFSSFIKRTFFVLKGDYIRQIYLMSLVSPKDDLSGLFSPSFNVRYNSIKHILPLLFRDYNYLRALLISLVLSAQLLRSQFS